MQLFLDCLKDTNISVKVAALKAITSFLGSIDDEEAVLKYQDLMDGILDVVIEVQRTDEDKRNFILTIEERDDHERFPDLKLKMITYEDSVKDLSKPKDSKCGLG